MSEVRDNLTSYRLNARIWFRTSHRPHSEKYFYSQVEVLRLKNMHALAAKGIFRRWLLTDQVSQRRKILLLRPIMYSPQPRAKDFDASRRQEAIRSSRHPDLVTVQFPPPCFLLPQKHVVILPPLKNSTSDPGREWSRAWTVRYKTSDW